MRLFVSYWVRPSEGTPIFSNAEIEESNEPTSLNDITRIEHELRDSFPDNEGMIVSIINWKTLKVA